MAAAARVIGTSTYNFVQGSETFVHSSTMLLQELTTMVQPFAKTRILSLLLGFVYGKSIREGIHFLCFLICKGIYVIICSSKRRDNVG